MTSRLPLLSCRIVAACLPLVLLIGCTTLEAPTAPWSDQRMSSPDGAKKNIDTRDASTPNSRADTIGETVFPFDFDMMRPSASCTLPLWKRRRTGSSWERYPASWSTFVMKRK